MDSSTFRRALLSSFGLNLVGRALNALTTIILLRYLATDDFAYIVLFMAAGMFLGNAAAGGARTRYVREEAERVSRGVPEAPSFTAALLGGTLVICGVTGVAFVVCVVAGIGPKPDELGLFIGLVTALAIGESATELVGNHYQAHLSFVKGGLVGVLRGLALLPVALAVAMGGLRSGVASAAGLTVATLVVGLVATLPVAASRRHLPRRMESSFGLGAESSWLTLFFLAFTAYFYMDVYVIAAILPPIDVATFGAAQRYYNVLLAAVPATLAVLRIRTSQSDIIDSSQAQREMLVSWGRRVGPPVLILMLAAAALAPVLIPVIDRGRYPLSIPVFQTLLVGALAIYITMPSDNLLMSQQRYRLLALTAVVGLAVKVVADLVGGALFGVVGVAAGTTAVTVATTGAIAAFALRRTETGSENWRRAGRKPRVPPSAGFAPEDAREAPLPGPNGHAEPAPSSGANQRRFR